MIDLKAQFDADVTYVNTATLGLPPRAGWLALQEALRQWRAGRADPPAYDLALNAARAAYAQLVGVAPGDVAVGSQVSAFAGLVAASLPPGSEVLTVTGDFTSILFPFHVQAARGVTVREVALEDLAAAVRPSTTLVAVSAVQSADGRVADLVALENACAASDARVLLDVTQAAGWLPVDAARYAYTVCGAYKWLLTPRGAAYLTIRPELRDELVPHAAGWYAAAEPWEGIYGSPLRLATDARRFDLSPAWHSWVGAGPAMELLVGLDRREVHEHSVGLANRLLTGIGRPVGGSAIVSLPVGDGAAESLRAAGVVASTRAGRLRLSFYICNDRADVDTVIAAVGDHVR